MTRALAAGHPLQQAVSFLFLFLLLFLFSLISLLFFDSVFHVFFFLLRSLYPIGLLLSSVGFVSSVSFFLTVFFHPFSKLSLFKLFFFDLLLLFCSSLKSSFSNFLFCHVFFELLCKNLSLLLFISCFFFRSLCFSVFSLSFVLLFLLFTCFL